MKKIGLWFLLGLLSLGAAGAGLWMYWRELHQENKLVLASQVLTAVYDRTKIETAEAVYQFIFPFDFLPWDPLEWKSLENQAALGRPIPPMDYETLALVRIAKNLGFDPSRDRFPFLVIGVRVKSGLDLEKNSIGIDLDPTQTEQVLEISLPDPEVTEFLILDPPRGTKFPPTRFSPLEWKNLVTALRPRIISRILQDGLLDMSRKNLEDIFHRVLVSSGFRNHKIRWMPQGSDQGRE